MYPHTPLLHFVLPSTGSAGSKRGRHCRGQLERQIHPVSALGQYTGAPCDGLRMLCFIVDILDTPPECFGSSKLWCGPCCSLMPNTRVGLPPRCIQQVASAFSHTQPRLGLAGVVSALSFFHPFVVVVFCSGWNQTSTRDTESTTFTWLLGR